MIAEFILKHTRAQFEKVGLCVAVVMFIISVLLTVTEVNDSIVEYVRSLPWPYFPATLLIYLLTIALLTGSMLFDTKYYELAMRYIMVSTFYVVLTAVLLFADFTLAVFYNIHTHFSSLLVAMQLPLFLLLVLHNALYIRRQKRKEESQK